MTSSQDTEITLGTGKLLVLFFGLVAVCALFFALGYSLGRKSEPAVTTASAAALPQPSSSGNKTSGVPAAAAPMTFYKAVEQKQATPELTSAAAAKTDPAPPASSTGTSSGAPAPSNTADPTTTIPTYGYFVQVAAVSKQEDADALVDALKKKAYPAFVAAQTSTDKLFRVQLGPYSDVKEAETLRAKLVSDGYSPILKK
jgi:cell division septation protein DedD